MTRVYTRVSVEQRFWNKVSPCPNTGCWLWEGTVVKGSAGTLRPVIFIRAGQQNIFAKHLALELHGRPRPSPEAIACHHCDMTWCVNPDHLYWGSYADNNGDRVRRGRSRYLYGEDNPHSRLTDDLVRYIRSSTGNQRKVAEEINVSQSLVSMVRSRRIWKHVV